MRLDAGSTAAVAAQFAARFAFLVLAIIVARSLAGVLAGTGAARASLWSVLPAYALEAAVLSHAAYRARWAGARLALAIFGIHFGVTVALTQVETLVFLNQLVSIVPAHALPRLVAQGTIASALIATATALLFSQSETPGLREQYPAVSRSALGWTWRVALSAVLYFVVYAAFGALVFKPLAGAAFDRYYAHLQIPAWMPLLQVGRGLGWTALGVLAIGMARRSFGAAALTVSLLFAGLMGSLLLTPNPYMPPEIRTAHFVEVTTSNFVYGLIVAALMFRRTPRGVSVRQA